MIGKLIATAILLLLAFVAFWGDALGAGSLINPFGILFLLLAAVTWFKWESVREAFRSGWAGAIGGMVSMRRAPPRRRSSSN
jgi:hypothetical protein